MVRIRHRGALRPMTAHVARDTPTVVRDLYGARGCAHLDLSAYERVRHAVEPVIKLDVVVDVHARTRPRRRRVPLRRERPHRGPIDRLEGAASTAFEFRKRPRVEILEQR